MRKRAGATRKKSKVKRGNPRSDLSVLNEVALGITKSRRSRASAFATFFSSCFLLI